MKKIYLFFAILAFCNTNAQKTSTVIGCINGPLSIEVGQTVTYSTSAIAQCSDCYDWDINNSPTSTQNSIVGNLQITSSDMNNTVMIKALSSGTGVIKLTYFDENGCHECFINVNINGEACPNITCIGFDQTPDPNDDNSTQFAFVNSPSTVLMTSASFVWKFKFLDGSIQTYYGQNPTFNVYCSGTNSTILSPSNNPVVSFGLIVTCPNGQIKKYYSGHDENHSEFGMSEFGSNIAQTCFIHSTCFYSEDPFFRNNSSEKSNKIIISPNPTYSKISFKGENLNQYKITIFDSNGNKIINELNIERTIDLKDYKKGIYFYLLEDKEGNIQKGKIIKE